MDTTAPWWGGCPCPKIVSQQARPLQVASLGLIKAVDGYGPTPTAASGFAPPAAR
ncbi:hypothetical protein JL475_14615 [Streptomyces sp. M2CJ-2]|uniref:hypothetical protein n=1 Tax=Streptomyces sp. M2CJ-2 TaxID=2803948 RepID=UPI0019252C6D|nr:hypothetical protein [Streptomyces sp. M2CJ-2]MBL3667203.1 hypothetical protein [Streptomyces sp. M2CJ-2]